MKKQNKKIFLFSLIGALCLLPITVSANSGSSQGGGGGVGGSGCSTAGKRNYICRDVGGNAKLWVSTTPNADGNNRKVVADYPNGVKVTGVGEYSGYLNNTYLNVSENVRVENIRRTLEYLGVNISTSDACRQNYKGHIYFSVEAPYWINGYRQYGHSLKELASLCTSGAYNCSGGRPDQFSDYLRITNKTSDSANFFYNITGGITNHWSAIADSRSGYGVFEVWMDVQSICPIEIVEPPKIKEECVRRTVNTSNPNPVCQKTTSTRADFYENVDQNSRTGEGGLYGNPTSTNMGSSYCTLYCIEQASIQLPKGYDSPLQAGTKLVFPSSEETKLAGLRNDRPIKFAGKRTCRVDIAPNSKNCSKFTDNYDESLKYVNKQANAIDYENKGYDSVRKRIESQTGRLAEKTDCFNIYQGALNSSTGIRKTNVEASIKNCEYYVEQFNLLRLMTGELAKCDNYDKTAILSDQMSVYNFATKAKVQNEDVEYNDTIDLVEETRPKYNMNFSCVSGSNCWNRSGIKGVSSLRNIGDFYTKGELEGFINKIESRVTKVDTGTVTYKLKDNTYNYINKRTNKATSTRPAKDPYSIVGYSNLPISLDAKKGVKINLNLKNVKTGHNGKFSLKTYTCDYELTNSLCVCPEGTLNEGMDLTCKLNEYACIEAQLKFCNEPLHTETLICPPDIERYKCKNTNKVGGKMDITSCVMTRMKQGDTKQQAIDYCDMVVCPLGIPIIYRVISLENPFPGKDIANRAPGFNLTVTGRYPGTNWNSSKLVKEEILNNRGVSAGKVYQKQPLYIFEINSKTVKSIRSYNKAASDGYSDFTLDCIESADRTKAGTNCISKDFVHDSTYGLVGGTCLHATGFESFENCVNK